jgi:hypothetical protein
MKIRPKKISPKIFFARKFFRPKIFRPKFFSPEMEIRQMGHLVTVNSCVLTFSTAWLNPEASYSDTRTLSCLNGTSETEKARPFLVAKKYFGQL